MVQKNNFQAKEIYLKQVKKQLSCPQKQKKIFLESLQKDLQTFQQENPTATMQVLTSRFGEPTDLAYAYIESLDPNELNKQIRKTKLIKRWVLITCILVVLAVVLHVIWSIWWISDNTVTNIEVTLIEGPLVETVTSETEDGEVIIEENILEEGKTTYESYSIDDASIVDGVLVD